MRVLFIDDRRNEVEEIIARSGIRNVHRVAVYIFQSLEECIDVVSRETPEVIFVGYGLSKRCVTGSTVINTLRGQGVTAKMVGNSGGGPALFELDNVHLDGYVDRNPARIAAMLAN